MLKKYAPRWADSKLPVIVHLMADRPEETGRMVQKLEGVENIAAVELGFAPGLAGDIILIALEMSLGELPLIVSLAWDQVLTASARASMQAGAVAISLSAPRGTLPAGAPEDEKLVSGRLYGPSLFPQALDIVHERRPPGPARHRRGRCLLHGRCRRDAGRRRAGRTGRFGAVARHVGCCAGIGKLFLCHRAHRAS